ncbi:MAG: DNA recombination protein RecN [Campylobacterales bacterium]|nr:DNA recombination protein RecN [Campylobacterales bacterium]
MIGRALIKNLLFFDAIDIDFEGGLVVFSGASGAGKSILMGAILATFGLDNPVAALSELTINKALELEGYDIDEEFALKCLKSDRSRYYIDGQKISKKALQEIFKPPFISYLSVRDQKPMSSKELLHYIDNITVQSNAAFKTQLEEYQRRFGLYKASLQELEALRAKELNINELMEFATFEIGKIDAVAPKMGEDEELLTLKQKLSKIDKVKEAIENANAIFELESKVVEVYRLIDRDSAFVTDTFNQIRSDFEDIDTLSEELEEVDIEAVLDRIEKISTLIQKYGSIEAALAYKEQKSQELEKYRSITFDRRELEAFTAQEQQELLFVAKELDTIRQESALQIQTYLDSYLSSLKLPSVTFEFMVREIDAMGAMDANITMNGSKISTLSGGEFNRLRLALMVVAMERGTAQESGVIILDEIDANVSGDESIAIANLIAKLAHNYQIFAISHQPHLSAKANQHILIKKEEDKGSIEILDKTGRINEIARIIAGENANAEAVKFAKKLLN